MLSHQQEGMQTKDKALDKLLQNIDKDKQEKLLITLNQLIKNMEGGDSNV